MSVPVERFDLRSITPQPWKNGAGLTREIALGGPHGADAKGHESGLFVAQGFDWRFSVAEVERSGPFSAYPGIDRCIVLLAGAGLHLRSDDGELDHRLDMPLEPFHFSGDLAVTAATIAGPSRDFNVMTRRGVWRCAVACHRDAVTLQVDHIALLLCCSGEWRSDEPSAPTVHAQEGLLWRAGPAAIRVAPQRGVAAPRLLFVQLCHDETS